METTENYGGYRDYIGYRILARVASDSFRNYVWLACRKEERPAKDLIVVKPRTLSSSFHFLFRYTYLTL